MKKELTNLARKLDSSYGCLEAYIDKYREDYEEFLEFYGLEDNYTSIEEFVNQNTRYRNFSEFEYNYLEDLKAEEDERKFNYWKENKDE